MSINRLNHAKKIISASRRTDIPSFYDKWFLNRIKEGYACYLNPFSGAKHYVSLKKEDVACFVFWSKNFIPFMDVLKIIDQLGYKFYFNYTINNYPEFLENNVPDFKITVDNLIKIAEIYSPNHINWRYDPIIITSQTDFNYHLKNFNMLASMLKGYVKRCMISYISLYGKVKKNFYELKKRGGIDLYDYENKIKIDFALKLAEIAEKNDISLYSCCMDFLISDKIHKAHCIDGDLINELFFKNIVKFKSKIKPTRKECGCTESIDIGTYNTCIHGCVYCYANINKTQAYRMHKTSDLESAFLGYNKSVSDEWMNQLTLKKNNKFSLQ